MTEMYKLVRPIKLALYRIPLMLCKACPGLCKFQLWLARWQHIGWLSFEADSGSQIGSPWVARVTYDFGLANVAAAQLSPFCMGRRIDLLWWLLLLLMYYLSCTLGRLCNYLCIFSEPKAGLFGELCSYYGLKIRLLLAAAAEEGSNNAAVAAVVIAVQ